MKLISLIVLIFLSFSLMAQTYKDYTVYDLFEYGALNDDSAYVAGGGSYDPEDSTSFNTTLKYWEIETPAATADTLISNKIYLSQGGNDLSVWAVIDSISATSNVRSALHFGYYRGPELGWKWTYMDSLIADGDTMSFHIPAQTNLKNEVMGIIGIKIEEILPAKVQYAIRIRHFRWFK